MLLQACLADGTMIYLEQLSHHPPVTAFSMEHPSGLYRFDGLSQVLLLLLLLLLLVYV